jgi:hypothetical protein
MGEAPSPYLLLDFLYLVIFAWLEVIFYYSLDELMFPPSSLNSRMTAFDLHILCFVL